MKPTHGFTPSRSSGRSPTFVVPASAGSHRLKAALQTCPRGLSLLEVILAIAVLGGCMAVIGELVRMGVRNAEEARELTKAQLLCESKLEEVAAGVMPLESAANAAFELDPDWSYTIETGSLDQQGLVQVRVTVQQVESDRLYPLTFTLTRWILDPSLASGETSTDSPTEGPTEPSGNTNEMP